MTIDTQKLSIAVSWNRYPVLRRLAIYVAFTCIFNVLIALAITYLMQFDTPFLTNLVFSMCIGTVSVLIIGGGKLLLWGEKKPHWTFFLLIAAAAPIAYYIGHALAVRLLHMNPASVRAIHMELSTSSIVLTLLASLFGTWFFWSRAKLQQLETQAAQERERAAATEKQALQAQLQLLQAQIEPHMLFNTLANLQALIAFDTPRAQHMLDQLIQYLRATLAAARAPHATLAQEFALLQAYLELMAIRMGGRLAYSLELPEMLRDTGVPPMLLQPLVENAIKHGVEPKIDGGRIDVAARDIEGKLELTVADTGLGLSELPSRRGTGVGLTNVRERLQALFGKRASFSLQANQPAGTIARLVLPMAP